MTDWAAQLFAGYEESLPLSPHKRQGSHAAERHPAKAKANRLPPSTVRPNHRANDPGSCSQLGLRRICKRSDMEGILPGRPEGG